MCGITGLWGPAGQLELRQAARNMADAIRHRGPDDEGYWCDEHAGIVLAHRRLSILDLSPEGHQPMSSPSGRYVITFNGEVYNYKELRAHLSETKWRGRSDTEVMLAAFDTWGVEAAVCRFVGMFAFAVWDTKQRALYLVRDRVGVKPLYYGRCGKYFLFGSELKAMLASPVFAADIDRGAVALLARHNYVPAPYSIYRGIRKLMPGTILCVKEGFPLGEPKPFWSARDVAEAGAESGIAADPDVAVCELHRRLLEATRLRMISDVPLGAFLSGGIDSSTVVALMQAQSTRPIRTFSVGFHERPYNEAPHAAAVARHLGTDHTEAYVTSLEAQAILPKLPEYFDEPFADSSQIPTFLVSMLARRHVTVALSGDGGDELFAGYPRYALARQLWRYLAPVPMRLKRLLSATLRSCSADNWTRAFRALDAILPNQIRRYRPAEQMHRVADVLLEETPEALYRQIISHWHQPHEIVLAGLEPPTILTDQATMPRLRDFTARMMFYDLVTYLPDDILTKVDRASMAVSLEARVPLLDHRVVEFAWQLLSLGTRNSENKWLLKQVLYKYLPAKLVDRPKMGFGVPIGRWLCGPLRDWAEDLLERSRLQQQGFFVADRIRNTWQEHITGRRNWQYALWNILMFQAWLEHSRRHYTYQSGVVRTRPKYQPVAI
jgi:asparagine synthase (glutamine-hydrolysing)